MLTCEVSEKVIGLLKLQVPKIPLKPSINDRNEVTFDVLKLIGLSNYKHALKVLRIEVTKEVSGWSL